MSLTVLGWLFTFGVLVHNTEEALYLPAWSMRAGRWYKPIAAPVFRFAVILLSGIFIAVTIAASLSRPGGIALYFMAGYVLAMLLNVFMPHVLATVLMRKYMPGTATAVLLNLPLGLLYLHQILEEQSIKLHVFYWAGPLIVVAIVASMPLLFTLGRKFRATIA